MAVWPLPRITFRELSSIDEARPVALLTSDELWAVLSTQLALPVVIQAEPARYDRELFMYLAKNLPSQVEAVYVVGGGAPLEAGKLVAAYNDVPLSVVPTALDGIQMFTPVTRMLDSGENQSLVATVETGPAADVIIDWGVIHAAPTAIRGAGIAEVLSVVTGLLDWRYAAQRGKNPREQRFVSWAAGVTSGLAKQAIKSAAAVGQGHPDALHTLLDLMLLSVQVNNQLGYTRAQQGSEHYLAQILEGITRFEMPHAALVGQCILFAATLHGQDVAPLQTALVQAGVPLDAIRATDFALLLENLDDYLDAYEFPYSVLNDLHVNEDRVQDALDAAGLVVQPDTWRKPGAAAPVDESLTLDNDFEAELAAEIAAAASEPDLEFMNDTGEAAVDAVTGDDGDDDDQGGDDIEDFASLIGS